MRRRSLFPPAPGSPLGWPVLGGAGRTLRTETLEPRTARADRVVVSVCPYCAVGCSQLVSVRDGVVVNIEGNPASPINEGTLCPKGAATFQLLHNPHRWTTVRYRPPFSTAWEQRPLEWAMERIAELVAETRDRTFVDRGPGGEPLRHTKAIAHLGGATLDNEENYLIKKLWTALGVVWVENQARV